VVRIPQHIVTPVSSHSSNDVYAISHQELPNPSILYVTNEPLAIDLNRIAFVSWYVIYGYAAQIKVIYGYDGQIKAK